PATHFIATSHLERGKPLWFNYLNALCFELTYQQVGVDGEVYSLGSLVERKKARESLGAAAYASGQPIAYCEALAGEYPLPPAVANDYAGMTHKQIAELTEGNLFEIGAHTVTHVYLSQVSPELQKTEIRQSKSQLEQLTGRNVRYFAYPVGD